MLQILFLCYRSCFAATGNAQSSDSISGWMIASVSRLQGLQAQHDHCHQAACTYFESAVTQLVSSLESVQDPGRCWLLQGLLCKARLAQAESCLYMVSKTKLFSDPSVASKPMLVLAMHPDICKRLQH